MNICFRWKEAKGNCVHKIEGCVLYEKFDFFKMLDSEVVVCKIKYFWGIRLSDK